MIQSKYITEIVNTASVWFNNNRIEVAFHAALVEVASVCICLLMIIPIILQNVSAKLPVGASNQPIKLHRQETIAARKIIIPDGAADQSVEFYYQPKELTISNDTSVTWVNQDSALHTATADYDLMH